MNEHEPVPERTREQRAAQAAHLRAASEAADGRPCVDPTWPRQLLDEARAIERELLEEA